MSTLIIEGFDAGDTYFYWRWNGGEPSIHVITQSDVNALRETLAAMLPSRRTVTVDDRVQEETLEEMLQRALSTGDLAEQSRELAASRAFTDVLLSPTLVSEIADVAQALPAGERVQLTLSPSARTAQIPWELLVIPAGDDDRRLIEVADIEYSIPRGIHVGRGRTTNPTSAERFRQGTSRVAFVVDPDTLDVELPVLAPSERERLATALHTRGEASFVGASTPASLAWQPEVTRRSLSDALSADPAPDRLLVVGHVAHTTDTPAATSLLLTDPINTYGAADKIGAIRPLSALDLLEGLTQREKRTDELKVAGVEGDGGDFAWPVSPERVESNPPGADIWPAPARVALIACNSGTDLGSPEAFGLVIVFANAGASLITATKWTLPTDAGMAKFGGLHGDATPFVDATLQVDHAHRAQSDRDVVRALCDWQRTQLNAWRQGDRGASPIIWSALSSYLLPEAIITENDPDAVPMPADVR